MADADQAAVAAPAILDEVRPVVMPRPVLVENNRSFAWISDKICGIIEGPTPRWW
jgi:molybdopterin-containing oxidoreductase family membrane subunit